MISKFLNRKGASAPFFIIALLCCAQLNAQSLKKQLAKGNVMLCAHRGGMYNAYAENSLKTLEYLEASVMPAPVMAEVDVRKSKDGTLFILHDNTLERTTTGTGMIEESSDEYLRTLKLRDGNGEVLNETIPTFDESLEFVAKHKIYLMLDVKIDDWKTILDLVKEKKVLDKCMVLTFKPENSKKVHLASPDVLISCLVRNREDWDAIQRTIPTKNMMAYIGKSTPDDVLNDMRKEHVFLVTDASEATTNSGILYPVEFYRQVIGRGVNVYVTDLPRELHTLLK